MSEIAFIKLLIIWNFWFGSEYLPILNHYSLCVQYLTSINKQTTKPAYSTNGYSY